MAMKKWKERVRGCQQRKDHSFSITCHPTTIKKEIKKQSNFILFFFFFLFSKPNFLFLSPKPTHIHSKSKQSKFPSFQRRVLLVESECVIETKTKFATPQKDAITSTSTSPPIITLQKHNSSPYSLVKLMLTRICLVRKKSKTTNTFTKQPHHKYQKMSHFICQMISNYHVI